MVLCIILLVQDYVFLFCFCFPYLTHLTEYTFLEVSYCDWSMSVMPFCVLCESWQTHLGVIYPLVSLAMFNGGGIKLHFIWVVTVCQSTPLGVSRIQ